MSLLQLAPNISDTEFSAVICGMVDEVVPKTNFARNRRHKTIAHRDFDVATKSRPLVSATMADIESVLVSFQEIMNPRQLAVLS